MVSDRTHAPTYPLTATLHRKHAMIRVYFVSVHPDVDVDTIIEMPAVPREGDTIEFEENGEEYTIRHAAWTPYESDFDVQVGVR
jgi:hypothetical protein